MEAMIRIISFEQAIEPIWISVTWVEPGDLIVGVGEKKAKMDYLEMEFREAGASLSNAIEASSSKSRFQWGGTIFAMWVLSLFLIQFYC